MADADDAISSDSRQLTRISAARISPPDGWAHSTRALAGSGAFAGRTTSALESAHGPPEAVRITNFEALDDPGCAGRSYARPRRQPARPSRPKVKRRSTLVR